jgi:XTP/dITP diphosphohydrolase
MSASRTLVVASGNRGKLREFRSLLEPSGWQVLELSDLCVTVDHKETGGSFAENARLKAIAYSHQTQLPVLADDSGLEVDDLGGRPGIHSARYAGEDAGDAERVQKLLAELKSAGCGRSARFVCAVALAQQGRILAEAEGTCSGRIAEEPQGINGFGYDPVFFLPELGRTYAELAEAEKNRISHRARALQALLAKLRDHQPLAADAQVG